MTLLDARGVEWCRAAAAVADRAGRVERLVVVTDQPVMHEARSLPGIVEYVPADAGVASPGFSAARLDEIRQVYAVTVDDRIDPPAAVERTLRLDP